MSVNALRAHYTEIADNSPVPVVLYSIPKYMHFSLAPQLVAELAKHENIIGIKDSSGDLELLSAYLSSQSDDFSVLTGNGSTFQRALELGATGGILAVSLFAPGPTFAVFDAMQRGSSEGKAAAERAQSRLMPLAARIVGEMGIAGIKAALDQVGLVGGPVRSPLMPLNASELSQVTDLLRDAELPLAA
jgi:dihydrodipicolinate synthase/N-acetylneuraminate lyase